MKNHCISVSAKKNPQTCIVFIQKSTRRSDSGSVESVGVYQDFDKKPKALAGDATGEK